MERITFTLSGQEYILQYNVCANDFLDGKDQGGVPGRTLLRLMGTMTRFCVLKITLWTFLFFLA